MTRPSIPKKKKKKLRTDLAMHIKKQIENDATIAVTPGPWSAKLHAP